MYCKAVPSTSIDTLHRHLHFIRSAKCLRNHFTYILLISCKLQCIAPTHADLFHIFQEQHVRSGLHYYRTSSLTDTLRTAREIYGTGVDTLGVIQSMTGHYRSIDYPLNVVSCRPWDDCVLKSDSRALPLYILHRKIIPLLLMKQDHATFRR